MTTQWTAAFRVCIRRFKKKNVQHVGWVGVYIISNTQLPLVTLISIFNAVTKMWKPFEVEFHIYINLQ